MFENYKYFTYIDCPIEYKDDLNGEHVLCVQKWEIQRHIQIILASISVEINFVCLCNGPLWHYRNINNEISDTEVPQRQAREDMAATSDSSSGNCSSRWAFLRQEMQHRWLNPCHAIPKEQSSHNENSQMDILRCSQLWTKILYKYKINFKKLPNSN